MERWADAPHHPNHQISSLGRVRHKKTKRTLKPFADRYGYLRVSLGNADNVYIHKLVCEAFHGTPIGDRNQVNHIDCNRQNNRATNLEWVTASENIRWGVLHGSIDPVKNLEKATEVNKRAVRLVETGKEFSSLKECAEYLGVKPTNISRVLTGSRKGQKLHGYSLEYV